MARLLDLDCLILIQPTYVNIGDTCTYPMSDPDKATCKYENIDYLKTALPEWLSEEKRVVNLMKALERASSI